MLVKKYGNRRLYDTEDSRYVRLSELAEKIRRGKDVRVVDAKTDADLTSETLVQIIFEDRHAARLLPVALLHQMVRMGDDALAEFLGRYLTWALEMYLQARQGVGMLGAFSPFSALASLGGAAFSSAATPSRGPSRAPDKEPAEPADAAERSRDDDVKELRRELDALKKSLQKRPR